ncbi:hypothetical protein VPH184E373B_0180 [Vibrio phage 184E37-3b]|nr:hypothetical protein MYOV056v2_p0156 [Vibrio phage 184E37.3a]QZI90150.1 hypothetical protein MYOV057v1_p0235 [Vibrio phage 184E37.1]
MLNYDVREWQTVTYQMGVREFKNYIKELRFFVDGYGAERKPKFIQLMRHSSRGMVTECATLSLELVGDYDTLSDTDLDTWFEDNYEMVYHYLVETQGKLY